MAGLLPTSPVPEGVAAARLSTRAVDCFRFHHGGGIREAKVQLRAMLAEFATTATCLEGHGGYLILLRKGYRLVLSPDGGTVTGYSTNHRERTWAQVQAGVKSRTRKLRSHKPRSPWAESFAPVPEQGPPVELKDFRTTVDARGIALTARVRRSYVDLEKRSKIWDDELDSAIRADFGAAVPSGDVSKRSDGMFVVRVDGRVWLVSPDARTLIGVRSEPAEASAGPSS